MVPVRPTALILVPGIQGASEHSNEVYGVLKQSNSGQKPTQSSLQCGERDNKIKAFFFFFWEINSRWLYDYKGSERVGPLVEVQQVSSRVRTGKG